MRLMMGEWWLFLVSGVMTVVFWAAMEYACSVMRSSLRALCWKLLPNWDDVCQIVVRDSCHGHLGERITLLPSKTCRLFGSLNFCVLR